MKWLPILLQVLSFMALAHFSFAVESATATTQQLGTKSAASLIASADLSSGLTLGSAKMTLRFADPTPIPAAQPAALAEASNQATAQQNQRSSQNQEQTHGAQSLFWDGNIYLAREEVPAGEAFQAPYTLIDDCNICMRWISAAVAWLPSSGFTPRTLQSVLKASCRDTWLLHAATYNLQPLPYRGDPPPVATTAPNVKARCEQIRDEDRNNEALFSLWTLWDDLYPKGTLPEAVCCRMERCPCLAFPNPSTAEKYYGPPSTRAPSYLE